MTYVLFFMQGEALGWYKWMAGNQQISTWEAFTRSLELHFGPSSFDNHQASPTSVTSLRWFLGLTGYYRKFVQEYASIASPLTDLLKKQSFTWGSHAQMVFTVIQQTMISLPVLAIPDFSLAFDVTTDASGTAVGAVLSQNSCPLASYSKKLCPIMQSASAYEREI